MQASQISSEKEESGRLKEDLFCQLVGTSLTVLCPWCPWLLVLLLLGSPLVLLPGLLILRDACSTVLLKRLHTQRRFQARFWLVRSPPEQFCFQRRPHSAR